MKIPFIILNAFERADAKPDAVLFNALKEHPNRKYPPEDDFDVINMCGQSYRLGGFNEVSLDKLKPFVEWFYESVRHDFSYVCYNRGGYMEHIFAFSDADEDMLFKLTWIKRGQ